MNKITFGFFAVCLYFTVGQALQCYKCDLGLLNICRTTKMPCAENQLCFNGLGKAVNVLKYKVKGCLDVAECNKTETTNFPGSSETTVLEVTKTCCSTDLCNSALGQFHFSAVSMAFTTISSVFMVKILI
ncbi:hypothetical protein R3I93_016310 [Phoxinus phoxinus]|uniref:UPAR/Ly6 domain-containing protein n=1 Tax=Phoxinus phoxinus TaxID=58324 RepID=A0AAN9H0N8_9TELE